MSPYTPVDLARDESTLALIWKLRFAKAALVADGEGDTIHAALHRHAAAGAQEVSDDAEARALYLAAVVS